MQLNLAPLRYKAELNICVTGDSLSFNFYSYDSIARSTSESGKGGYKSWSYLVRDAFLMNLPGWIPAVDFLPSSSSTAELQSMESVFTEYEVPADGRCMSFRFAETGQKAAFFIPPTVSPCDAGRSTNDLYLYYLDGGDQGGHFTLRLYDQTDVQIGEAAHFHNMPDLAYYLGQGMRCIKISTEALSDIHRIEVELLDRIANETEYLLSIIGIARSKLVWKNTGKGSKTSRWLADQIQDLVIDHKPDITFIIIGANDPLSHYSAMETYTDIKKAISSIRENTQSEIILLSIPPNRSYSDGVTQAVNKALEKAAAEYECGFVDLFRVFSKMGISEWRYDDIHFNKYGNQVVFETLAKLFFPTLPISLNNQYNHHCTNTYSGEQHPRNYMRWREWMRPIIQISWNTGASRFEIQRFAANWFVSQSGNKRDKWLPFTNHMIRLVMEGSLILKIELPFTAQWLTPRYEPASAFNYGESTAIWMLRPAVYDHKAISFYLYKYMDEGRTDQAGNTIAVKEWKPVTHLYELDNSCKFILNLQM